MPKRDAKKISSQKELGPSTKHSWHKSPKVLLFIGLIILAFVIAIIFFGKGADAVYIFPLRSPTTCAPINSWNFN